MESHLLTYPKKSHRKIVSLPSNSEDLAELMGIIAGDGGIGIRNYWQFIISLNSEKDKEYAYYVKVLIEKLFLLNVVQHKRPHQNTIILVTNSTSVVDFLVEKGAARGNKIVKNLDIPSWILEKSYFLKRFIRGLVDTDGCLYLHRHFVANKSYLNIGFCFTSYTNILLFSIAQIFKNFGLHPHITDHGRRIYFYSQKDVVKYLDIFGSSNPRIYSVYKQWRDSRVV